MQREPQQATEPVKPFDAGDPEAVAAKAKTSKGREARIKNGLKLVLGHPDSRLWLHSQLNDAGPFTEAFTGNSTTFYNCGKQAGAKRLMATLLDDFLDEYVLMMKEAKNA